MTNQEAAEVLQQFFMVVSPARANGKSRMSLRMTEALLKAIECLKAHLDT